MKIQNTFLFLSYCFLLTWMVSDHIFFWDTVQLASKHAHWYYEHNFSLLLLPESIDSGHPPFFGMYLATLWKLFGKSLMVSHFSILPFLWGIVWLLGKLGTYYGNKSLAPYLLFLVLFDPFFAGQSVLVSPDILLLFAFLLSISGILFKKHTWIYVGVILLSMISLRGMMVVLAIFIWWVLLETIEKFHPKQTAVVKLWPIVFKAIKVRLPFFLPGGTIAFMFLSYHYYHTGWIGYHPASPWAESFQKVDTWGFLRNIGLLVWRLIDHGRIFLWLGLIWFGFILYQNNRSKADKKNNQAGSPLKTTRLLQNLKTVSKTNQLLLLIGVLFFTLCPSLLIHKGLMAHRYLMPLVLILSLLFYHLFYLHRTEKKGKKAINRGSVKNIFIIGIIGLLTGNCWIYPKHIAQGWDATLAHIPYYQLRAQMVNYLDENNIPLNSVGTVFPNIGPLETYELNNRTDGFSRMNLSTSQYVFYSSVFNDFTDEELKRLEKDWILQKKNQLLGIEVILYKKANE